MKPAFVNHVVAAGLSGLLASTGVQAANPLGFYVGAGGGLAEQTLEQLGSSFYVPCGQFFVTCSKKREFGWTAFAGLQPIRFLGAELQYLDFGHASESDGFYSNSKSTRALALFGTGTLPLPFVDLYAKAGVGRLHTTASVLYMDPNGCLNYGLCGYLGPRIDKTNSRFGYGAGAQVKFSSLAIRVEYVQFSAPEGDPDLLSLELVWKF